MIKQLYVIVTNECDLSCPHCDIKSLSKDNFNEEIFMNILKEFNGDIILFGGEPTLHKDRLLKILSLDKATSISTNLVNLDDDIIPYLKDLYIATSWNFYRFNPIQCYLWLNNLKRLHANNISCRVLITLTKDLIESDVNEFIDMIKVWDKEYHAIDSILFEQLIDENMSPEFYEQVDEWLCKVHNLWEIHSIGIKNLIMNKIDYWYCDCENIYTLHPDGKITNGCPHKSSVYVPNECLICPQSDKCKPCRLQKHCTYPRRLAQLNEQGCDLL